MKTESVAKTESVVAVKAEVVAHWGRPTVMALCSDKAGGPRGKGLYARENGDTSTLPLFRHLYWASKGLTLIEIVDGCGYSPLS